MQDAFDRGWWERVSGGAASSPTELPVDLDGEGLCDKILRRVVRISDILVRFPDCFKGSSLQLAHPNRYPVYAIHSDEVAITIHCLFDRCFSSGPGHVPYFFVDFPNLLDIPRRRLCLAAGNTGRMDPAFCRTGFRSRHVMEGRGPLNPATERRWHEGVHCLDLVEPTISGWEAENSDLRADYWQLDKR